MKDSLLASHPEDLLDRVRRAPLSIVESRILKDHLAICPTCAVQSRTSSVTEEAGLDDGRDDDHAYLEQAAMDKVFRRLSRERNVPSPTPLTMLRRKVQWAAAILLCSGTGAAATWWSAHHLVPRTTTMAATHASHADSDRQHPVPTRSKHQVTPTARW